MPILNTYPTISSYGLVSRWSESGHAQSVNKKQFISGAPIVISTKTLNTIYFNHELRNVTDTDKDTLDTFYAVNKATEFFWLNPDDNTTYVVRFNSVLNWSSNNDINSWNVTQHFKQYSSVTISNDTIEDTSMFIPAHNIHEISGSPERSSRLSLVGDGFKWTASSSGTNEYYVSLAASGDPLIADAPQEVYEDGFSLDAATAGSLSAEEWDYADNDSLGYSTIYVRLSDNTDPDSKAVDYIEYIDLYPTEMWKLPNDVDSEIGFTVVMPPSIISGTYKIRTKISYSGQKGSGSFQTLFGLTTLSSGSDIRTGSTAVYALTVPTTNYLLQQSQVTDGFLLTFSSGSIVKGILKRNADASDDYHDQSLYVLGFELTLERQ